MLAAAMCRAVGIPSRVVIGLVYVKKQSGFGFHMWNEVYVNQRWVAIDPAWNESTGRRRSHQDRRLEPGRRRSFRGSLADTSGHGEDGDRPDRIPLSIASASVPPSQN